MGLDIDFEIIMVFLHGGLQNVVHVCIVMYWQTEFCNNLWHIALFGITAPTLKW